MEEVIKATLMEKDRKISQLEQRVDELKQNTRRNDLVTGLETRHRTYARATAKSDTTEDVPGRTANNGATGDGIYAQYKNINIQSEAIPTCHKLRKEAEKSKPAGGASEQAME